jgi:RimJ/RimL family protein N-acetyltransferase
MQVVVQLKDLLWRPLTSSEEDTAFVLAMRNAPLAREALFTSQVSREEHLRFLRSPEREGEINWIIERAGERLGASGIWQVDTRNQRAMSGRVIAVLPELYPLNLLVSCFVAFEHLHLNKLTGDTLADNLVVSRALERLGAVREGLLQEHVFKDGQFRDVLLYGMLARRWREMKGGLYQQFGEPRLVRHAVDADYAASSGG